jgi:hypothetical protein
MKEFEENNPEQLKLCLTKLKYLVDDFHHNIYLLDGVFEGIELIDKTIKKQLNKE